MFCSNCGTQLPDNSAFCSNCGQKVVRQNAAPVYTDTAPKISTPQPEIQSHQAAPNGQVRRAVCNPEIAPREKVLPGIFGALIGAVLGGLVIILFYRMDLIASLSGVALAFFTTFGYRKLSGRLSKVGMIVCVVLIAVVPYLAYRIDLSMELADSWNAPFSDIFNQFHSIIDLADANNEFMQDMLGLYGFTLLGAVGTFADAIKKQRVLDMQ